MFLKNDGTLWGMGDNGAGQLGDANTTNRLSPVQPTCLKWLMLALTIGQIKSEVRWFSLETNKNAVNGWELGDANVTSIDGGGDNIVYTKTDGSFGAWVPTNMESLVMALTSIAMNPFR